GRRRHHPRRRALLGVPALRDRDRQKHQKQSQHGAACYALPPSERAAFTTVAKSVLWGTMRGLISLFLLTAAAYAQPAPAPADPRAAEAKQRYENGMAHFNLEEWDSAIEEWKAGYRAKPVAQFLYNIAQAYRLNKHYDDALSFYQRYLRADPKAPNRVE